MRPLSSGLLLVALALTAPAAHGQSAALHWDPATGACNDAVLVSAVGECEDQCIGLSAPRELSTAPQKSLSGWRERLRSAYGSKISERRLPCRGHAVGEW
jgi:hypothetical protein